MPKRPARPVPRRDPAAHPRSASRCSRQAVADDTHRLARRIALDQCVEVGDVVGEPVAERIPAAAPKPRRSGAITHHSRASASTRNWNDAATSIQPCRRNRRGASCAPHSSTGSPVRAGRRAPRAARARARTASLPAAALRQAVLPSGAVVAAGGEARGVLAFDTARARTTVGEPLAIGRGKPSRLTGGGGGSAVRGSGGAVGFGVGGSGDGASGAVAHAASASPSTATARRNTMEQCTIAFPLRAARARLHEGKILAG